MGKLTARMVASLSEKGRYHDGDNLVLQVGPNGNKSWLFAYMLNGRSRAMGLGSAKLLTLQEARDKAFALRRRLKLEGIDPIDERKAARARPIVPTFAVFADEWITAQEPGWRNDKHKAQWRSSLATYAYPVIGDLPVDVITTDHVMKIVEPIWATKSETADRVRTRIAQILDAAKARQFRSGDNPAQWRGALKHLLPAQSKVKRVKHHGSLPFTEIPTLMGELRERNSISAKALQFVILTSARTAEVTEATWDEFDLEAATWLIPEGRTKQGREHRVPLSDRAVEILRSLPREADNPHAFVGSRYKHGLSNMAMLELLRGMRGRGVTVHGTARSGFRTWATEAGHPRELAEAALGHVIGDATERSYARGDLFQRRRVLMDAWTDFLSRTTGGSVVPMPRKRGEKS